MSAPRQVQAGIRILGRLGIITTAIQLAQLAIVARLVEPEAFGSMMMVTTVSGIVLLLQDAGTSNALIHRQSLEDREVSSVFWLQVMLGLLFSAATWAAAPFVAAAFAADHVESLFREFAPYFLLMSFGQTPAALLERDLRFDAIFRSEGLALVLALIATVGGAYLEHGAHALVWGQLVFAGVRSLGNLLPVWAAGRFRPAWSPGLLRPFFDFGLFHMGQRVTNYATGNLDFILVGRLMGSSALGYYSVIFNIANTGPSKVSPVFSRVFFPAMSRSQADAAKLREQFMNAQRTLASVNFPMAAAMMALAPAAISTLLGSRWMEGSVLLQVLAVAAALRGAGGALGALLMATGSTRRGFLWSLILLAVQAPCLLVAAQGGSLLSFVVTFSATSILFFALSYPLLVRHVLGPCLKEWLATLCRPAILSLATLLFTTGFSMALPEAVGSVGQLVFAGAAGLACHVVLVAGFDRKLFRYFVSLLTGR
jgi:lipopolysaccharide exporter